MFTSTAKTIGFWFLGLAVPGLIIGGVRGYRHFSGGYAVQFESTKHNFGKVSADELLPCEFRFTNVGRYPVMVEELGRSCRCLIMDRFNRLVLPGESGSIKINLDTTGMNPGAQVDRKVSVRFEHESSPSAHLEIKARVRPEIVVEPDRLSFIGNESGDARRVTVRRETLSEEAFGLLGIKDPPSYYEVNEINRNDNKVEFEVRLIRAKAPGHLKPLHVAYVAQQESKVQRVETAYVPREFDVEIFPQRYFLSLSSLLEDAKLPENTSQEFRLDSANGKPVMVTNAVVRGDVAEFVQSEVLGNRGASHFRVWLKRRPRQRLTRSSVVVTYLVGRDSARRTAVLDIHLILTD